MVLLVKLKNPHRRVEEQESRGSPAAESESSQEYRSALEQDHSPTPPPPAIAIHDNDVNSALDELSSALQQTQIGGAEVDVVQKASLSSVPSRPAVDVLVAPAVLGHRWVRTRSNSFVVERPERVRAVSLGIAALLAKVQSTDERLKGQLESVTSSLASLNVQAEQENIGVHPLSVHLSRASLSLAHPSAALRMVHALDDELLSAADMKEPSPYHSSQQMADSAVPTSQGSLPYTSFLDKLCSQAPFEVPPPPPPRNARSGVSPSKTEDGYSSELHHPSEVPLHLPQGDLYLCGPKKETSSYFAQDSLAVEMKSETSPSGSPHTPDGKAHHGASNEDDEGEEHWRKGGSRGAIEAALGTGCAAVDRVVCASRGTRSEESQAIHKVDLSQLHRAGPLSADVEQDISEPALRSFVLVRPPGHHCNATQPSGFCWVNNVAVMAAHAYEQHGIDRVAILDFDLHHGSEYSPAARVRTW